MLVYRRPRDGLNFISRLFAVPGIQPGIPGLTMLHFLFDSMHVLELGVLPYLVSAILWALLQAGFFGIYNEAETDRLDAAMSQSIRHFYDSRGVPSDCRVDVSVKSLGTWGSPAFKAKASQAKGVLPWMVELLSVNGGAQLLDRQAPPHDKGSALLECCTALTRI